MGFWNNLVLRYEIFVGLLVLLFAVYLLYALDVFKKK